MKHAFIMSPLSAVKPWKDTTYFLMLACAQRGHQVCFIPPSALWLAHDQVHATVQWLAIEPYVAESTESAPSPFRPLKTETIPLSQVDVVWIRTDPPFDRRYFYATLLLDHLPPATRVINRPAGLRNWNEKLAALIFPEYTPPTVVACDIRRIQTFAARQGRIAIKPMDGFGGHGIVFYRPGDDPAALHAATANGRRWVIAQAYLHQAADGDKRILLLNGEPLGGILRLHADGAELNNLDAGATAHPLALTARDRQIAAAVKPGLMQQGIFFAGIDIIGEHLIEVNVTSPTGLQELCRFDNTDHHHRIIAMLE